MFSFQITLKLNNVSKSAVEFFIKGNITLDSNAAENINPINWLSPQNWKDILKLTKDFPKIFTNLDNHVINNIADWQTWYDLEMPESSDPPFTFPVTLEPFYKLMLLRCFRVDRIYQAITNYIALVMGDMYITTPIIDYDGIYSQTKSTIPGLFILSPGSDPTLDLMKLGNRYEISSDKFKFLSLGQGQEQVNSI